MDRAATLTRQLLAFARRQALKPEVFDLGERVRAVSDMLGTIVSSRVRIVADIGDGDCLVEADARTALINMAVNARDAMNGEGTLTVRVTSADGLPRTVGRSNATGRLSQCHWLTPGTASPPTGSPRCSSPFSPRRSRQVGVAMLGQGAG